MSNYLPMRDHFSLNMMFYLCDLHHQYMLIQPPSSHKKTRTEKTN